MKYQIILISTVLMLGACNLKHQSDQPMSEPTVIANSQINFIPGEGVIIDSMLEIRASVIDIDQPNRVLTIEDPNGVIRIFNVLDQVRNFDQISVGDAVVVTGYAALMMELAQPGDKLDDTVTQLLARTDPGEKPGIVEVDIIERVAEITNINLQTRTVTVTGPEGNEVDLIVPPHIEGLENLKTGDKVNTAYLEAFAISVEAAES